MICSISNGFAIENTWSSAKFSGDKYFRVKLPTQIEMNIAINQALSHADMKGFIDLGKAIMHSIRNLLVQKHAEAESGEIKVSSKAPKGGSSKPNFDIKS